MLIASNRILDGLAKEVTALLVSLDAPMTDGSPGQAILAAIQLLRVREMGDAGLVRTQFVRLTAVLDVIEAEVQTLPAGCLAAVRACLAEAADQVVLPCLEAIWRRTLRVLEATVLGLELEAAISPAQRQAVSRKLVLFELDDLQRQIAEPPADTINDAVSTPFDHVTLSAYLRARFDDAALSVGFVKPVIGGYGKQTTIFSAQGRDLCGEFVIRRNHPKACGIANQCYRVHKESPVIRAAAAHGFPAPELLWLDTEHAMVPGGDFIVMRRAPGAMLGNVFGAQGILSPDVVHLLADTAAQLHTLPKLRELGDLTETIRADLWDMPLRACTEHYVRTWLDTFMASEHTPSPALVAVYGWLLDNIPDRPGRPVLLHGDLGLHNMLFHAGAVSVVVDWESAYIGDPASDIGYIRETLNTAIDWPVFVARYEHAGGQPIDPVTLHFFRVWAHMRNAAGSNMLGAGFSARQSDELKLVYTASKHFPFFLGQAQRLIDAGP